MSVSDDFSFSNVFAAVLYYVEADSVAVLLRRYAQIGRIRFPVLV